MTKLYTIIHAHGELLKRVADHNIIYILKKLTNEELAGICLCNYITDYLPGRRIIIKDVDMTRMAEKYIIGVRDADGICRKIESAIKLKYRYELSCSNTNYDICIMVTCNTINLIKGFLWMANIMDFPIYKIVTVV